MKSFALLAAVPATVWAAAYSEADYDSGRVHEMVMQSKKVSHRHLAKDSHQRYADSSLVCLECYARAWRL